MRRATMSAPGSPWIRASSAEASSDLIGGIRYRLAVQLPHLAFLTRHLLAPLCQELVDGRDRVTQQLAGQALRTPHRGLACHQGDDPFFLDTDDELVPLGEPRLLPNRRGQSYSAVLREPDPNWIHDKISFVCQRKQLCQKIASCQAPVPWLDAPSGPVAQRLELAAHNGLVAGSNPAGPTPGGGVAAIDERARPAKRPLRKPDEQRLFNRAVFYLGRFAASERHLADVLRRKALREAAAHDFPASEVEAMIGAVLARLRGAGYLDDDRYAAAKARSLAGRGRSQAAIRATLARQGAGRETAAAPRGGGGEGEGARPRRRLAGGGPGPRARRRRGAGTPAPARPLASIRGARGGPAARPRRPRAGRLPGRRGAQGAGRGERGRAARGPGGGGLNEAPDEATIATGECAVARYAWNRTGAPSRRRTCRSRHKGRTSGFRDGQPGRPATEGLKESPDAYPAPTRGRRPVRAHRRRGPRRRHRRQGKPPRQRHAHGAHLRRGSRGFLPLTDNNSVTTLTFSTTA